MQGNATNTYTDIEFQAFRPDVANSLNFILVYGNRFDPNADSRNGSKITMSLDPNLRVRLPIEREYIVGVRLNSSSLGLLYDPTGGVDVYYWDNQGPGQSCNFSLCDVNVKVLRDVTPLISWTFGKCRTP